MSYAEAGLILTALSAGGLAGNFLALAADFVDRRRLATLGALVYGLCLVTFAAAHTLPVLLVAAFCWGAASAAFVHGCEVALVELYPDDLAPALGRVNAYGAVGDLLAPLTLAASAALGISWRGVFLFGGILMLLYACWIALQPFPATRQKPGGETPGAAVLGMVRDPRVILLALVNGLFGLLDEPFLGFTMAYLETVRRLAPAVAATIAVIAVAGGIAGFLIGPAVARRLPDNWPLLLFAVLVAIAVPSLAIAPVVPLQLLCAVVFGFSGAAFYAQLQAAYLGLRPGRAGTIQAVVSTIGLAGVGFPTLVGVVSDARGLGAGLALYAAVPVLMLILLVGDAVLSRPPAAPEV